MATMITMPSLGESVAEGEVGKWLVQEGQQVDKDQPLVEIMTDKADSEIPATASGVVTRIFVGEGDTVLVGDKLCEIDPAAQATASAGAEAAATTTQGSAQSAGEAITSPTVRKLAREKGVDVDLLVGSGEGGRVTHDDVARAAQTSAGEPEDSGKRDVVPPPPTPARTTTARGMRAPMVLSASEGPKGAFELPAYRPADGDEVVPFSRRRRIIADHMVFSKLTSPHVVTFAECDLHRTAALRDLHKADLRKQGINLTYLAFIATATVRALQEFPDLNARVLDDAYVKLREINLGIAVDTPEGLVVPVIRNADELSIRGVARGIADLAEKAREGRLVPDDLANKTFTISNPGRKGNLVGGAIISQPNVGILRVGEIKKRVVVVERDGEDTMTIHPVMYMALSYDHRIVDGVHANGFLWRINQLLEEGDFEV